jgi:hypothetical protein
MACDVTQRWVPSDNQCIPPHCRQKSSLICQIGAWRVPQLGYTADDFELGEMSDDRAI